MKLHCNVKMLMAKYGLNQTRICEHTGMDKGYLSRCLRNESYSLTAATLEKIVAVLRCNDDERLELYRIAKRMPPEIHRAFCADFASARRIQRAASASAPTQDVATLS